MNRPGRRLLAVYLVALLGIALLATGSGVVGTAAAAANAPTCDGVTYAGAGTSNDPYEVGNVEQLQCINGDHGDADSRSDALSSDYELVSDVDASGTSSWNGGKGFDPIGEKTSGSRFGGSLDGQGHTISHLIVHRLNTTGVGLFGFINTDVTVSNVSLRSIDVTGGRATGGVSGYIGNQTEISTVSVSGTISGETNVGGIAGSSVAATVSNASATAAVTGSNEVGGLIGDMSDGSVTDAVVAGSVTGAGSDVGSVIGLKNDGASLTTVYRDVETAGRMDAIGSGSGTVTELTTTDMTGMNATRNVETLSFYDAWVPTKGDYPEPAALAGTDGTTADAFDRYFAGDGTEANPYEIETAPELRAINDSLAANYALASDVDATETERWNDGKGFDPVAPNSKTPFEGAFDGRGHTISNVSVNRSSSDRVGLLGFVGDSGTVTNVSVSSVDVDGRDNVGGLAGRVDEGTVRNVSISGTVNGSSKVGGLAGYQYAGSAAESASTVTVSGDDNLGGLVGYVNDANVSAVHASGAVHGPAPGQQGKNVGGLVGRYSGGTIHDASASGNVSGPAVVGGLVGNVDQPTTATDISAVGDVAAESSGGSLVGSNSGTVRDAFASGAVTGSTTGGLVGRNVDSGTITDAYWDTVASGTSTATGQNDGSADATGLTTAEMTGAAAAENMANLTFADPWVTTDDYPVLQEHVTGLSLDLGTTSLTEGDTTDATVALSLLGGGTEAASTVATYTTTDADIADVEAGTLTAAGVGSTTISANHAGASESIGVDVSAQTTGGSEGGNSGTADRSDDGTSERTSMAGDGAATVQLPIV